MSVCPDAGKTYYITGWLIAWYLCFNVNKNVMVITYNRDFGNRLSEEILDKVYQIANYCGLDITSGNEAKRYFKLSNGCTFDVFGRSTGQTGYRAHLLVIDDIYGDDAQADSPKEQLKIQRRFDRIIKRRLHTGVGKLIATSP